METHPLTCLWCHLICHANTCYKASCSYCLHSLQRIDDHGEIWNTWDIFREIYGYDVLGTNFIATNSSPISKETKRVKKSAEGIFGSLKWSKRPLKMPPPRRLLVPEQLNPMYNNSGSPITSKFCNSGTKKFSFELKHVNNKLTWKLQWPLICSHRNKVNVPVSAYSTYFYLFWC